MASRSALDAALAEAELLKGEINRRSDEQKTLFGLNVTAVGVLLGFVLATNPNEPSGTSVGSFGSPRLDLLFVLPVVGVLIGLLWIDHHRAIQRIGDDLNRRVAPMVREYAGCETVFRWEAENERVERARRFPYFFLVLLWFGAGPIVALVVLFAFNDTGNWRLAFGAADCLLTIWFVYSWICAHFFPNSGAENPERSEPA